MSQIVYGFDLTAKALLENLVIVWKGKKGDVSKVSHIVYGFDLTPKTLLENLVIFWKG